MKNKNAKMIVKVAAVLLPIFMSTHAVASVVRTTKEVEEVLSDAKITASINTKLIEDAKIKNSDIKVHTTDGKVEITGIVPDEEIKNRILKIAKETKDVRDVTLRLEINPASKPSNMLSDSAITAAIKAKYLADPDIKGINLYVETINGVVNLKGQVANGIIKDKIVAIARDMEGVKEVKYDFQFQQPVK